MNPYEKCWNDLKQLLVNSVHHVLECEQKKMPIEDPKLQLMVFQKMMYAVNELEIAHGIQGKTDSPIITA